MSCGIPGYGVDLLLEKDQVKRVITTHIGSSKILEEKYFNGEIELELTPEGNLAERVRAGGAGIPGFFTRTGVNTIIEDGDYPIKYMLGGDKVEIFAHRKPSREFGGIKYLFEEALSNDYALVKAWKADTFGNLVYRKTARNFNPEMAMSANVTIAEVEEIVEAGELKPEEIHTPGIFVKRLVKTDPYKSPIETMPLFDDTGKYLGKQHSECDKRIQIAKRAAKELKDGMYVHLGIGIPSMVSNFMDKNVEINFHTSSGVVGSGPTPTVGSEDPDLVNTSREATSIMPGGSVSSTTEALNMLRGGHLDLTIVGGFQVSKNGDLANWIVPGKYVKGIGSSMDCIAHDKTKVIVCMRHTDAGKIKILKECSLPITGRRCVDLLITELAVFDFQRPGGMTLTEIAPGVGVDEIKEKTGCSFDIDSGLKQMSL